MVLRRALALPIVLACVLLAAWQLRTALIPIVGEHNWRQADTYAVAFNFAHESPDFFHPRIDWTRGRSGIMGMEAPIYPFVASLAMRVFGDAPATARVVAWLMFVVGVGFAAWWLRPPEKRSVAAGFVVMAIFSPMALFEFRQLQPDGPMVALLMIAAALFHRYAASKRRATFAAAMVVYSMAVLIKSPALVVAPAMWMFSWSGGAERPLRVALRALWFAAPVAAFFAWNAWSRHIDATYAASEAYFWTGFEWSRVIADLQNQDTVRNVFVRITPSYATNWVLFPAVVAGLVLAFERENRAVAFPMLVWLALGLFFCAAFSGRVRTHWYYALIVLPPLAYLGALTLGRLFDLAFATVRPTFASIWVAGFTLLTFVASPLAGGPQRLLEHVPGASDFPAFTTWISEPGLLSLAVIEAVAVALTFVPGFRKARLVYVVALVLGGAIAMPRAFHDAREALLWRCRQPDWARVALETASLRSAVDAVSTRADSFVVDGTNPWYLHRALRKGWVHEPKELTRTRLQEYAERGARFFVHFADHGERPPGLRGLSPVAREASWELYCIDDRGCDHLARR